MAANEKCPKCGFIAHMASSDGKTITYVCERCGAVFSVKKQYSIGDDRDV